MDLSSKIELTARVKMLLSVLSSNMPVVYFQLLISMKADLLLAPCFLKRSLIGQD
jgi:hypothetical protein